MHSKQSKTRNPIARQLPTPAFRKRIIRSRKLYRRMGRGKDRTESQN